MKQGSKLSVAFVAVLLGAITFSPTTAVAQLGESIKPYVLIIMDVSGSMNNSTGNGPSSCGGSESRIDHAKCALQQVVDAHADIQFGLARFRQTPDGGGCDGCEDGTAVSCITCESNGDDCTPEMKSPNRFQLLVPFVSTANDDIHSWVDFSCGAAGCSLDPSDNPDLRAPSGSWTPIGGSLRGAKRFFEGGDSTNILTVDNLDAIYGVGIDDPIGNDPLSGTFVAPGQQCRPYVVVLLTDGEESCEQFDDPGSTDDTLGAAAGLLTTPYGGNNYRVEVKPIGFGTGVNDNCTGENNNGQYQVEKIARVGGNPGDGLGGNCEGYYADNESQLITAFNEIIADSILVEICDGLDNDCDGEVDEGFQLFCDKDNVLGGGVVTTNTLCTNPGDDCDGVDDNCVNGTADEVLNACGTCGDVPEEVCNLSDDDCDGLVDEDAMGNEGALCNGCVPTEEICDGLDNDCDDQIDEGLTQECGTDVGECIAGIETCILGSWENCTAVGGNPETCDGLDNDCDGTVDGFVEECSVLPDNQPPYNGVCQPGFRVCPVVPEGDPNSFGECRGEIGPSTESCDGLDNDCDGPVNEDTGGADCSSACGPGTSICNNGVLECDTGVVPGDEEICNGVDDDCDGLIDEDIPSGGECLDGGLCQPGELQCIGGRMVCTGGEPPGVEICDCLDNDCDDEIDEEPPALCPTGATCTSCQCAYPCGDGEFPCPVGRYCGEGNFCLIDPCYQVTCDPTNEGAKTTCVDGECVPICDTKECIVGLACRPSDGTCQFDDCRGFPERCSEDEFCVGGTCKSDPCAGVTCDKEQEYCLGGNCVGSCSGVSCSDGEVCELGECVPEPCGGTCTNGRVCGPDNTCTFNPCPNSCDPGQVCSPSLGECIQDPCIGVQCPGVQECQLGTCMDADLGDGGVVKHTFVGPGGGGGCGCSQSSSGGGPFALFVLACLLCFRREWN